VRLASVLACRGSVCHPERERKKEKNPTVDVKKVDCALLPPCATNYDEPALLVSYQEMKW